MRSGSTNPGLAAAHNAAAGLGGLVSVVVPNFGDDRPDGFSDFNDLAMHRGADAVLVQIEGATTPPDAVRTVETALVPRPFTLGDLTTLPRREFVGGHPAYPRGTATAVVAAGGVGKTALMIAEALQLVTGKALLRANTSAPSRVWVFNLEEPEEELHRRIAGACAHFGIDDCDLADGLFVNSGLSTPLVIAESTRDGTTIAVAALAALEAHITERHIDVLVIDPFVSCHRVSENDNGAVDAVAKEWARLAYRTNCCVVLAHHTRKVSGRDAQAEDSRGAGSLVMAVRLARVLNAMTTDEAQRAGVLDDATRYFRATDGKANLTLKSGRSTWFRMESVSLPNATECDPGDDVGVVTAWHWPDAFEDVTLADLKAVQCRVAEGEWRASVLSPRWAGFAIADVLGLDPTDDAAKAQIKSLLRTWIKTGALRVDRRLHTDRKHHDFVIVGAINDVEFGSAQVASP